MAEEQNPLLLCKQLLLTMMNWSEAEQFLYPVPWEEWNLRDYPEIVKEPMDLTTIKNKLDAGKYKDMYGVIRDIRLIWSNCILYNPEGSEIRIICDKISQKFEDRLKALVAKLPANYQTPSVDDKNAFSENFSRLQPEQLKYIVTMLKQDYPYCVKEADGFLDIIVDAIPPPLFRTLYQYQSDCLDQQ